MENMNKKMHENDAMPESGTPNQKPNPIPQKDMGNNWDEKSHLSRNIQKNIAQNERRNLNPDREKRSNSNLNPDRNSGDR